MRKYTYSKLVDYWSNLFSKVKLIRDTGDKYYPFSVIYKTDAIKDCTTHYAAHRDLKLAMQNAEIRSVTNIYFGTFVVAEGLPWKVLKDISHRQDYDCIVEHNKRCKMVNLTPYGEVRLLRGSLLKDAFPTPQFRFTLLALDIKE